GVPEKDQGDLRASGALHDKLRSPAGPLARASARVRTRRDFSARDFGVLARSTTSTETSLRHRRDDSIEALLKKYSDRPISLADACLIRCAEIHEEARVLT